MKNKKNIGVFAIYFSVLTPSFAYSGTTDPGIDHSVHRKMLEQAALHASEPQLIKTITTLSLPDITLVNQEGQKVGVLSDLASGKVVLLNTIFTTCTTICSPMGANFAKLQKVLTQELGETEVREKVILLSVSVDPATDTPQRLKAWKEKFNGQPGWTLLTGPQADIDKLLKATGLFATDFADHAPIALLGDADSNQWIRISGLTPPHILAKLIADQLTVNASRMAQEH